jgi:D-alanine-D-alanine ligase
MKTTTITDPKQFGRVAVLMGGTSSEREVSLNSGGNVVEALRARGVDAHAVDGIPALIAELQANKFDRVFNILHGGDGENGVLQGLLEAMNIPYTGSDVLGSALSMDKIRTKQVWLNLGLPTPNYIRLNKGDDVHAAARQLGLPVIIKPSCEGSSVGVSRVFSDADLDAAVELAARYPGEMLMEQLIEGGEYTIGVLNGRALASVHIVPAGEYYDYHSKYISDDTRYICPGLPEAEEKAVQGLAEKAFASIGCSGWARVDFMRDKNGGIYLLEANTAPGMTSHSLMPKSANAYGIDFQQLCWTILETSFRGGAQ